MKEKKRIKERNTEKSKESRKKKRKIMIRILFVKFNLYKTNYPFNYINKEKIYFYEIKSLYFIFI